MNNAVNIKTPEIKENVIAGIVGAFLFSLAGAIVYFLLNLIGYIASASGLIGAVCAVKGYAIFSKKESKKGIIISAIISLLVMVLAWYLCLAYDIFDVYKTSFDAGEIDFSLTFSASVRLVPVFLEDPEISVAYFRDLALGLLFCLGGCASFIINKLKNAGKKNLEAPIESFEQSNEKDNEIEAEAITETEAESSKIE